MAYDLNQESLSSDSDEDDPVEEEKFVTRARRETTAKTTVNKVT
jgi:hypothetical protein